MEKEKIFQYSYWSGFLGVPDLPEKNSVITFELKTDGTSTSLSLTQENFPTQTSYEHSDKGWDQALNILKEFLEK
ncbi:hypothetical protein LEP1GSC060_3319 [Leptospira weilii serovar Ranarum str. ICFT]|uniref:Activator of Hsp90 ATPase homologue 1/2-like C-terminal domain-containing protein n=1 Tax=Leptospira weilii serovar Ranarum str. ICFT TaxID=1218598 RepID=N1WM43_9LEPT|nr:hypothetical protein LEP1GSC060_3319 [Leptospira weilii serovar Ranarum str. ICFT]